MKFYGQFSVPVDEFIYERYFKNDGRENAGFFIECGAFDGLTECSCKFFEETLGWKGINVEPSPPVYQKLLENRPNSTNINAALSNGAGKATFHSVIHPDFGELCSNGSLCHGKNHLKSLQDMKCLFKDYEVDVISYTDLLERCGIKTVDLFVLDVEGNELNVIASMKGASVLPEIFVVEHGNLNQDDVIRAVEELGYDYDTKSYVNSFFVKRGGTIVSLWRRLRRKLTRNEEFFTLAEKTEKYLTVGRFIVKLPVSSYKANSSVFALIDADTDGEYVTIFSVCSLEGEDCAGQMVYYEFEGTLGDRFFIKPIQTEREDYAKAKGSELYLRSGNLFVARRDFFRSNEYNVNIFLENSRGKYKAMNLRIKL